LGDEAAGRAELARLALEDLDGHAPLDGRLPGLVHDPHAAGADPAAHGPLADLPADHEVARLGGLVAFAGRTARAVRRAVAPIIESLPAQAAGHRCSPFETHRVNTRGTIDLTYQEIRRGRHFARGRLRAGRARGLPCVGLLRVSRFETETRLEPRSARPPGRAPDAGRRPARASRGRRARPSAQGRPSAATSAWRGRSGTRGAARPGSPRA